jgi:hypothetical protein
MFQCLGFSLSVFIPAMLHTHHHVNTALMRKTNWRKLGNLRNSTVSELSYWTDTYFRAVFVGLRKVKHRATLTCMCPLKHESEL